MALNKKKLLIIVGVIIGSLLILLAAILATGSASVRTEVIALPEDSSITLNDEPIEAGTVTLEPGTHTFVASREHFSDAVVTIHTDDIASGEPIYLLPTPDTDEAFEILAQDPDLQFRREEAGALESERSQRAILRDHPYVENLPHEAISYKIDYGFDENDEIFFIVTLYIPTATPEGTEEYDRQTAIIEQRARNYLQDIGVDTSEADITFRPAGSSE